MNEENKVPFKWEYGEETISARLDIAKARKTLIFRDF